MADKDMRTALAKARDMWLESDEGCRCCEGAPTGIYLRNRIECAFLAGVKIAEAQAEEKLVEVRESAVALADMIRIG